MWPVAQGGDGRRLLAAAVLVVAGMAGIAGATDRAWADHEPPRTYTVQPGDTLWRIAQQHDLTAGAIAQANGIDNPDLIHAGRVLELPGDTRSGDAGGPSTTYTVQPGDTLWRIAQRFDSTVRAIVEANALPDPDVILVGQVLTVPGAAAPGGDGDAVQLTQRCEAPPYAVSYPDGWSVNPGTVADACGWFNRTPFEVEPATELITDIVMSVEPVPFERIAESFGDVGGEVLTREETTVDGRPALRVERRASGEGLLPAGTLSTQYVVDLGDGDSFTATTYDTEGRAYEANQTVLDRMVETVAFRAP